MSIFKNLDYIMTREFSTKGLDGIFYRLKFKNESSAIKLIEKIVKLRNETEVRNEKEAFGKLIESMDACRKFYKETEQDSYVYNTTVRIALLKDIPFLYSELLRGTECPLENRIETFITIPMEQIRLEDQLKLLHEEIKSRHKPNKNSFLTDLEKQYDLLLAENNELKRNFHAMKEKNEKEIADIKTALNKLIRIYNTNNKEVNADKLDINSNKYKNIKKVMEEQRTIPVTIYFSDSTYNTFQKYCLRHMQITHDQHVLLALEEYMENHKNDLRTIGEEAQSVLEKKPLNKNTKNTTKEKGKHISLSSIKESIWHDKNGEPYTIYTYRDESIRTRSKNKEVLIKKLKDFGCIIVTE